MTGHKTNLEPNMRAAHEFPAGSEGINADADTDQVKQWEDEDFSYIIHYNAY